MPGVRQLVIDAPARRNALSRPVLATLLEALNGIDHDVTGVVLSGNGDAFSAGADFAELTGTGADLGYDAAISAVTAAIRALPVLVVAALEGPCMGAAADIALACDLRVAGEGSFVQVPAVRLGILYNPSAVDRLRRGYPADSVRRLLLLGERFAGEDALRAGFVSYLAPRGAAVKQATDLLSSITTDEVAAIAATKHLLNDLDAGTYDAAQWEGRRRQLLDSPARLAAVQRAHRNHPEK